MRMWKLKGCPRCGGDVFIDKDLDNNWYAQCLQCAYQRELRDIREFMKSGEKPAPAEVEKQAEPVLSRRPRSGKNNKVT